MKRTILFALFLCVACPIIFAQNRASNSQVPVLPVDDEAVWNPSPRKLSTIRGKCGRGDPGTINNCFLSRMESARASLQAVAFAKSFAGTGLAYLRAFRKTGAVDIAYVEYAFRANELEGVLLVNGEPSVIDVDDPKFLSQESFSKDPTYVALAKKYPQVSIWPGNRYHTNKPSVKNLESGGLSFAADYILRDGCHSCVQIGTASLIFAFDRQGRFSGVQVQSVLARP